MSYFIKSSAIIEEKEVLSNDRANELIDSYNRLKNGEKSKPGKTVKSLIDDIFKECDKKLNC